MLKRSKNWLLLLLTIIILLVVFLGQRFHASMSGISFALINKPLPEFKAVTLDDNPEMRITNQDFLGHITLLNIWASTCVTCQAENAIWLDIAKGGQVLVYGLNYKDKRNIALDWLKRVGDPYTLDIYDPEGKLWLNLGISNVPVTFLIDQNGIIRYKYTGAITPRVWQEDLLPRIQKLQKQ